MVASFALPMFLVLLFGLLFKVRSMAPRGMMKIGISMLQITATANRCVAVWFFMLMSVRLVWTHKGITFALLCCQRV